MFWPYIVIFRKIQLLEETYMNWLKFTSIKATNVGINTTVYE
jgi:hypothetical protein